MEKNLNNAGNLFKDYYNALRKSKNLDYELPEDTPDNTESYQIAFLQTLAHIINESEKESEQPSTPITVVPINKQHFPPTMA